MRGAVPPVLEPEEERGEMAPAPELEDDIMTKKISR